MNTALVNLMATSFYRRRLRVSPHFFYFKVLYHKMSITRLVRFVGDDNNIYYGDANSDLSSASTIDVSSTIFESVVASDARKIKIKKLLCPLSHSDVRSIICIGLNYRQHAEEAKMAIPTTPVVL